MVMLETVVGNLGSGDSTMYCKQDVQYLYLLLYTCCFATPNSEKLVRSHNCLEYATNYVYSTLVLVLDLSTSLESCHLFVFNM